MDYHEKDPLPVVLLILVLIVIFVIGFETGFVSSNLYTSADSYKNGQIDAQNGKIKYKQITVEGKTYILDLQKEKENEQQ